jgi:uncharacterized protein (DUF433 family)
VRALLPLIVVACGLLVFLWLLHDAMIFGLCKADLATGRARGCYTEIELLFAFKTPSSWVRPVELEVGVAMFVGSLIAGAIFIAHIADGMTPEQVFALHPELTFEDIAACLLFLGHQRPWHDSD